jgi:hypothetical protein
LDCGPKRLYHEQVPQPYQVTKSTKSPFAITGEFVHSAERREGTGKFGNEAMLRLMQKQVSAH